MTSVVDVHKNIVCIPLFTTVDESTGEFVNTAENTGGGADTDCIYNA